MSDPALTAHYDDAAWDAPEFAPWRIGLLLEEGDSEALRRLFRSEGAEAITDWLEGRGRRQLTRRSRTFWRLVLGGGDPTAVEPDDPLWPH